ncbi:LLM class oxidoreductase [Jatrophihabitans fulvus]
MRYWLSYIACPADQLLALARHAEHLGFEGVMGPDHSVWWGGEISSRYPYNDTGQVWWPEDTPWPDPWVTAASMAAVTTRLKVGHHVFVLPLRDPVNTAKAIATTSAIAGGRTVLAFGVGWMREEFELVGQQFARRGRRVDEMLDVMQLLWSGEKVSYEGEFYRLEDVSLRPTPAARVPLIGSGHSSAALRRTGRRCDGWLGATRFAPGELEAILSEIDAHRADAGRLDEPFDVMISVSKRAHERDVVAQVEEQGVTDLISAPWTIVPTEDPESLSGKLASMDAFAARLF